MIYLFDRAKKLQKIIPRKHIINANPTVVRNGIYQLAVEVPLFYEDKKGTQYNYQKSVGKATFAGYYDIKNRFQLYKIYSRNINANDQGEILLFDGVHIFFDEAKAMGNIHDRRFRDSEAKAPADAAFNSIGWTVIDYDVTDRHDINFYRASVTDAWNELISTYGVEFDYELQFDGRKIISKNIIMKKQIGRWTGQRFAYGTNVMTLTQEQDESEVYTAAVGRGRGEESGDGFGPRLEFGDIEWSKDGISKPVGQNYIELPSATAEYGFVEDGVVKPRIAPEVIFEDIEDKKLLADSTYQWLLENCLPKATWKTEVARIGNLELGDTVGVLYKAAGIIKRARVEKIEYNLLDPELSKLTLGDFHHFENRQMKRINAQIKRLSRDSNDRITRIKNEWNAWIDNQFTAAKNEYEQALIDVHAEIEADRENMTNLINTKTEEFDASLAAGMEEAERKRQENYTEISNYVNTTVDTTRANLETSIDTNIAEAKTYAEQQATEKANEVKTTLKTVTDGHQAMLDSLQDNVMNIDDFLGDKTVGLNELLINERIWFEEKLNNVDTWHYNMLRGSRFDEPTQIKYWNGAIKTDEEVPYYEYDASPYQGYIEFTEEIQFEAGQQYTLSFDVQTLGVKKMDYTFIIASPDDGGANMQIHRADIQDSGTNNDIFLFSQYRRYWIKFTPTRDILGTIRIGANLVNNELGYRTFKIRLPYLTTTDNTRWLYHQLDNSQNIEEITRRVMQLEDGREELITRTQYDFDTEEIEGTIRNIRETVDGRESLIQNHEDWILTNGASVIESAEGFQSKAWLSDIHNPNIIPYSAVQNFDSRVQWDSSLANSTGSSYTDWMAVRHTAVPRGYIGVRSPEFEVIAGKNYVLTFESWENGNDSANTSGLMDYIFLTSSDMPNQTLWLYNTRKAIGSIAGATIYRNEIKFTANNSTANARVLIGTRVVTQGLDTIFRFRQPKLEMGTQATPYHNAFSNLTQRADEIMLAVQGVDTSGFLSQSDIQIVPDYVQIGSQRLDGSNIGSLLRVSPTGIDAVAEAMRLSGNLYVDGDITALAVEAVEGNFARLFANNLTANVIKGTHIDSKTITSEHIVVNDVLVDLIVARSVFADDVTAKVGNFIDLNAGNIVTAGLSANVITADHIQVGTALIDKFFANSARIDELITKTHFVNEMHALTLNVVDLNASHIRSRLLTANVIEAEWLKSGTALLDRVFASTAMFERMMAKSGFVTTLNTVTIDTDQITIRRPDGGTLISQGMQMFGSPVITKPFPGSETVYEIPNYVTVSRGTQTFERAYGEHSGRWMNIGFALSLRWDSVHASSFVAVTVRPQTLPVGVTVPVQTEQFIAYRDSGSRSYAMRVRLPVPTYGAMSYTLEFHRVGDAGSVNYVQIRSERCWVSS